MLETNHRLHTIHFLPLGIERCLGDQLAELKDMPVTYKPSVEIVEILNQKNPQPKQAGKPADKPTLQKSERRELESLAQKTSETQVYHYSSKSNKYSAGPAPTNRSKVKTLLSLQLQRFFRLQRWSLLT